MTKPSFHRAPQALEYADLPNSNVDLEHDAIAQASLTDRNETQSYLERGRRFERLTMDDLGVLWRVAFEDVARGDRRDDVVQQQVVCGSQYYDGYRTRTARC